MIKKIKLIIARLLCKHSYTEYITHHENFIKVEVKCEKCAKKDFEFYVER